MPFSEIKINIQLDDNQVPEFIAWDATDKPEDFPAGTKAMLLSLWDEEMNSIMKTSLWTKDMMVGEMKRFFIQTLGGMAETMLEATGDQEMFDEVQKTLDKLATILQEQEKREKKGQ